MEKTPAQVGQELLQVVYKASGTKKRHDELLNSSIALRNTNPKFNMTMFAEHLNRKMKLNNEGLILSYDAFYKLFGAKPTQFDVSALQPILTKNDLCVVPLYKKISDQTIAAFIIIHRKLYMATELSEDMRRIITGQPITKNPKAWIVGTAIKISEELGALMEKASVVYTYDVVDALNILVGDEVYFISHNFLTANNLNPQQLSEILVSKGFFVDQIKSDILRDAEKNEFYKNFAEVAGLNVSKTEIGIKLGRDNIETLFRCSEQTDTLLQKAQIDNEKALSGTAAPTRH